MPNISDLRVNKLLTQISIMYRNDEYISEKIMPVLKVKDSAGLIAKYGKENLKPYTGNLYRAPGTRAHTLNYSVSHGSYMCTEKAAEMIVSDEEMKRADKPYFPKRDTAIILSDNVAINQELVLSTTLSDTSTITNNTTLSGTSQWTDTANSTPLSDITAAIEAVRTASGKRANTLVFGYSTWRYFKQHPDVRDQLKYTGTNGNASDSAVITWIKDYFNVREVLIGAAVYNSAVDGQSDSMSNVWGGHFWAMYKAPMPSLMMTTFGLTLTDKPTIIDEYREEAKSSDIVRIKKSYDQTIIDTDLCYLIKDAV